MSTTTEAAQKAVLAINTLATVPNANRSQRLIALHQVERHLQGHIRKLHEDDAARGGNPVSQRDQE